MDPHQSSPAVTPRRRLRPWLRMAGAAAAAAIVLAGQAITGHDAPTPVHADASFDATLFSLINQDRAQNGLGALRWNGRLTSLAESQPYGGCGFWISGRAQDMIQRNYFSHTICGTQNVFNVMSADGLPYGWAGENIGWESGITDPVQAANYLNTQYMNSPEHRANILSPNYTDVGVGSATGDGWTGAGSPLSNVYMSVEDFASLPASAGGTSGPPINSQQPPPPAGHNGYWIVGADGSVFDFGAPGDYGSDNGHALNNPIVGMSATSDQEGYWLVASDGGIFPHGDAVGLGSTGGVRLNQPIVGMASTPSGHGYWLVARDGGIFPFGDAGGYGSTGAVHLNQPIVGMAATPNGGGYWLVARDGGIFPFGDAGGYGSTGAVHLNQPIVGMASSRDGGGYWLVAADGGIFPFGDAAGMGSTGGRGLAAPVVGMVHG